MPRILVVDDERAIRNTLREILEYEKYMVDEAQNGQEAIEKVQSNDYDLVLCDIKMPGIDGIEVLDKILEQGETPVIMISGHGTIDTAVEAIKKGAFDYISKPLDLNRLLVSVRNALDRSRLLTETRNLRKRVLKNNQIIGESNAIKNVLAMLERVAPTNARVLITGENGTGKELVARALHENSPRAHNPFVEVNCAAIPSELIESQLFGHEKGSFTSAIKQRKGDFELANGGTLFLDEIGDMPLALQTRLLRVLAEKQVLPLGATTPIPIDLRVIAATHCEVRGKFNIVAEKAEVNGRRVVQAAC